MVADKPSGGDAPAARPVIDYAKEEVNMRAYLITAIWITCDLLSTHIVASG